MSLKTGWMVGILLFIGAGAAQADDQSSGCGMGWKVVKKNGLLSSITRAYTNSTFSSTIGMTSGTSGCAKHSIAQKEKMGIYYAEANYHNLMMEMAQGEGNHLAAFGSAVGCSAGVISDFSRMTQKKYSEIYSSDEVTPTELYENLKRQIKLDEKLSSGCEVT